MNAEREDNKTLEFLFSRVDDEDVKALLLEAFDAGYEQAKLDIVTGGL